MVLLPFNMRVISNNFVPTIYEIMYGFENIGYSQLTISFELWVFIYMGLCDQLKVYMTLQS